MRKAQFDANGVLLAHGFCDFAVPPGGSVREVPDDFGLTPGQWRWNGNEFELYEAPATPAPQPTKEALLAQIQALAAQVNALPN